MISLFPVLYKEGPPFFHGSYSVVVKFTDSEGKPVDNYSDQRQFTWTTLAGLKRITEHVGKVMEPELEIHEKCCNFFIFKNGYCWDICFVPHCLQLSMAQT